MIAGLLYLIGLVSVAVTAVMVGFSAPTLIQTFTREMGTGGATVFDAIASLSRTLAWIVTPVVGGLVLMALGRVIMLLSSINRSLRGNG